MQPVPMPPTLVTDRLTLVVPTPADLEDSATMWADERVYAMIGGRAFSREETWHRLLRNVGQWTLLGFGMRTVRETASGRFVGEVGLMDSRRATDPGFEGTPECGWTLSPHAHGRGYALEAVSAVLAQADAHGIARTVCIIDPANATSIRLAGKLGYAFEREVGYKGGVSRMYGRAAG